MSGTTPIETDEVDHVKAVMMRSGSLPVRLSTMAQDGPGATPLFMVIADYGWSTGSIAADLYYHVAQGITLALAAVLDCEYDVTATADLCERAAAVAAR